MGEAFEHGGDPADVYAKYLQNPRGYRLKWAFGIWLEKERKRLEREEKRGVSRG